MIFSSSRPGRRNHLAVLPGRRSLFVLVLTGLALPAEAAAATVPIKTGYYADLIKVRSAEVTFHVRTHDSVPDLVVICENPTDPSWLAGTAEGAIAVHMPKEIVRGGKITYDGPARVTPGYAGAKTVGTSKVRINLHHVDGPVLRYTFEGLKHAETRAWVGTVSTTACKSLPLGGQTKLYGPVAGE
jgi:hypothetical protein